MRKIGYCVWLLLAARLSLAAGGQELLAEHAENSAANRWLNKKVLADRLLDSMHKTDRWTAFTTGAPQVVDARKTQKTTETSQSVAEVSLSRQPSRDGQPVLTLRMPARLDAPGPKSGRGWGSGGLRRTIDAEDWSQFNRLSFWVHPDCPGLERCRH